MSERHKDYLGDSVYVEVVDGMVCLTTDNGMGNSNEIFLEPEVMTALLNWYKRLNGVTQL